MTEIYTPEGVSNLKDFVDTPDPTQEELQRLKEENKERFQSLIEFLKPITLEELEETLNTTVKHDTNNKIICFLSMLLNYTEEDQVNLGFNAESSTGKSYIPLELAQYFPQEDILYIAYSSPTAFFYDYGEFDEEKHVIMMNLHQKILIFLDMPHDMLLQRLRPILSHDRKEMLVKTTDRNKRQSLSTKNVLVIGYPTAIFCSANPSSNEQEKTRMFLLSPETTSDKLKETINLILEKQSDRRKFKEILDKDPRRNRLKTRVYAIKMANIEQIVIKEELKEKLYNRFIEDHKNLIPRYQRDFPRLIVLCKHKMDKILII